MARSSIIQRWVRGSLLIMVLVLVAAEAIWNSSSSPACFTKSFITYSAIGLRQILP